MTDFGRQTGEVGVGTVHDSVTLEDGRTIEVGDVVGYDVQDKNLYRDAREEPVVVSEVVTGTIEKIYNVDGNPEVAITNDDLGRIDAEDLQDEPERFDRFRSKVPEGQGCIIERWWGAFFNIELGDQDEYTVDVNPT